MSDALQLPPPKKRQSFARPAGGPPSAVVLGLTTAKEDSAVEQRQESHPARRPVGRPKMSEEDKERLRKLNEEKREKYIAEYGEEPPKRRRNSRSDPAYHAQRALPVRERMEILAEIARDASVKAAERIAAVKEVNDRHLGGKNSKANKVTVESDGPVAVAIIPAIPKQTEEEEGPPNDA